MQARRPFLGRGVSPPAALVPHGCSPELPDIVVHRCRRIDPIDVAQRRPDGIRLTSVPRTIFDAAALVDEAAIASVIEQALAEQRCTLVTMVRGQRAEVAMLVTVSAASMSQPGMTPTSNVKPTASVTARLVAIGVFTGSRPSSPASGSTSQTLTMMRK